MAITTSFKVHVQSEFDNLHEKLKYWQPNITYYDLKKELEDLEEDVLAVLDQTRGITEIEEAEEEGYERGLKDGYDEGHENGKEAGYHEGYDEGFNEGYDRGRGIFEDGKSE